MLQTIMDHAHGLTRPTHIAAGVVGLVAFWIPILVRKGGRAHVAAGRIYVLIDYLVLATAAGGVATYLLRWNSGAAPVASGQYAIMVALGFLTITALALLLQGRGAIRARHNPAALRTPFYLGVHALTAAGAAALAAFALLAAPPNAIILLVLAPLGLLTAWEGVAYAFRPKAGPREWLYQHLNGMIGSGVAFYTAFAVFGAQHLFGVAADRGVWTSAVPWLLPAVAGLAATIFWKRKLAAGYRPATADDGESG